jgi:hypothetical protein
MSPNVSPSAELSVALLSWINDRLRESAVQQATYRRLRTAQRMQHLVTILALGLSGLCVVVLQTWS